MSPSFFLFFLKFWSLKSQAKPTNFFVLSSQAKEICVYGQAKPTKFFSWSSQANEISSSGQGKPDNYLWLAEVWLLISCVNCSDVI
jgi:hypothetical protein